MCKQSRGSHLDCEGLRQEDQTDRWLTDEIGAGEACSSGELCAFVLVEEIREVKIDPDLASQMPNLEPYLGVPLALIVGGRKARET